MANHEHDTLTDSSEAELVACAHCGELHDPSEMTETANGDMVCETCLDDAYFECADCGKWCPNDGATETHDGDLICEVCRDYHYFRCYDCEKWFPNDQSTEISGGHLVCEDCLDDYFCCDYCGNWHPEDETNYVENCGTYVCDHCADYHYYQCRDCGRWFSQEGIAGNYRGESSGPVCQRCYEDRYITCDECGDLVFTDDAYYDDSSDCWYCEGCYNDHRESSRSAGLHNYGYKPDARFFTRRGASYTAPEELTFGVELEMCSAKTDRNKYTNRDACCAKLEELTDAIYMKSDSSLDDDGIEVVTHPCTLDYHTYEFRWKELCRIAAKDYGYRSHDTGMCGLHVHVGRKQLGSNDYERDNVAAKVNLLIYRHWDNMLKFSRRNYTELRWCQPPEFRNCTEGATAADWTEEALRYNYGDHGDRYYALNLTNNATIEFRIFRGTLKRDTIIAALQLVNNLCKYAMKHELTEVLTSAWADIIAEEPHKELNDYCKAHSLELPGGTRNLRLISNEEREALRAERAETQRLERICADADALLHYWWDFERNAERYLNRIRNGISNVGAEAGEHLQVGDRIIIVDSYGEGCCSSSIPLGAVGTIVEAPTCDLHNTYLHYDNGYAGHAYGILFDHQSGAGNHNLNNLLPDGALDGDGYYVHEHNVSLYDEASGLAIENPTPRRIPSPEETLQLVRAAIEAQIEAQIEAAYVTCVA